MSQPLAWIDLIELVRSRPKPPVRARIVEQVEGGRTATVLFDGIDLWMVDNGERVHVLHPSSALFWEKGRLQNVRGMGVAADNWAKMLINGGFAQLERTNGSVVGEEELLGRRCWVVETAGLRHDEPEALFRMWVDQEMGITLRSERLTPPLGRIEMVELTLGTIDAPRRRGSL